MAELTFQGCAMPLELLGTQHLMKCNVVQFQALISNKSFVGQVSFGRGYKKGLILGRTYIRKGSYQDGLISGRTHIRRGSY